MTQLQPFDETAIKMLRDGGMTPVTSDVIILANDLQLVAIESQDYDNVEDDELACWAEVELGQRIGGLDNLQSYMKCLRAKH